MSRDARRSCPPWCAADHAAEDDPGVPARHRSETVVVPGIALRGGERRMVESIELLIELHADDGDPVVGVYVGDGEIGLDLTTETAERLVRRLGDALRMASPAGAPHPRAAPNSSPSR